MKIIAECGCNWDSLEQAKEMIRRSKEVGCFASKFQIYNEDVIKSSLHFDFLKSIMINKEIAEKLFNYGKSIKQEVFFSVMYPSAIEWLENKIGVNYYKIRFADCQNEQIIKKIEKTKKPFFLSTNFKKKVISKSPNKIILYCSPHYPSLPYSYNIYFNDKLYLNKNTGISSHCKGLKLLRKALEYNVSYFEVHLMLDDTHPIEEKWSLSFKELNKFLVNFKGKKRVCSKCYKTKEIEDFYIGKEGINSSCKECQNNYSNDWYSRNKFNRFQYRQKRKKHYKQLNEKLREKNKEARSKQIEEWKEKQIILTNGIKSLSSLHRYIIRRKKKPQYCEICNEEKKLDLASINHIYTRNPNDYFYLCRSCHSIYDQCRKDKETNN